VRSEKTTLNARSVYLFGFNGKETDKETDLQDYGMRIYNPSLGRFLSTDPLSKDYPELTPYQFASNRPINSIDIDGLEQGDAYYYVDNSIVQLKMTQSDQMQGVLNRMQMAVNGKAAATKTQQMKKLDDKSKSSIDLSSKVKFISQWTLPRPEVACCRTSQQILKDFGITAAGAKTNRIITARDNSDHTAIEPTKDAEAGVQYINQQLDAGKPVMVGVNHTLGKGQGDGESADHFVVITGRAYDGEKKQYYFKFYEVGSKFEDKGKSDKNRLYVNDNNTITGTNYAGKRQFTVTDIRRN
jgi:RHS repeat-associated protein